MSKHLEKYPGLYARCKAAMLSYQVMYMRCRSGMSVDDALAKPVARCGRVPGVKHGPRPPTPLPPEDHRSALHQKPFHSYIWDRPGWNAAARRDKVIRRMARKRYIPKPIDTSPAHIRVARAALCDQFIKFGTLDQGLMQQLTEYANECRSTDNDLERVSAEQPIEHRRREEDDAGDDGGRDDIQIDAGAAERIADFLRA